VLIVPAVIVMLAGLLVVWLARQSWQERLTRNWIAGVRTPSTMRSDEAFRIANKTAAPLTGAGGVILFAGGLATALVPKSAAGIPLFGGTVIFLALAIAGAIKGIRACR
jgi:uncharacterized membrane protein